MKYNTAKYSKWVIEKKYRLPDDYLEFSVRREVIGKSSDAGQYQELHLQFSRQRVAR